MSSSTFSMAASLLLGAVFLCVPAYYNGYPLWFQETAAYLQTATTGDLQGSSNAFYAGLIRYASWAESLWIVLVVQGILISLSIYYTFNYIFINSQKYLYLFYILIAGSSTALSFHVSHIMPDIFTPIMLLTGSILLLADTLSKRDGFLVAFLFLVATSMHNAQWGIMGLILLIIGMRYLWSCLIIKKTTLIKLKRLVGITLLTGSSFLLVSTVHYSLDGRFKATRGASIYLFARLSAYDLAQSYLKNTSDTFSHPIKANAVPLATGEDYLWGVGNHTLNQHGGWSVENKRFFESFNAHILAQAPHYKRYLTKNLEQAVAQVFNIEMQPIAHVIADSLYQQAKRYNRSYTLAAYNSRQRTQRYAQDTISAKNHLQQLVIFVSILLLLAFFYQAAPKLEGQEDKVRGFILFLLLGLGANALVTVSYWGDNAHFQSRVAWLLTLPAFWLAYRRVASYSNKNRQNALSEDTQTTY